MVIDRWECEALKGIKGWVLVYGRRKTGKTFLVRRCLSWDLYVLVSRGGECYLESGGSVQLLGLEDAMRRTLDVVRRGGLVILDEFQRLPERTWDLIALAGHEASDRLVLCGSSLTIVARVFDRRSPLLGLLAPFKVDVVSPSDAVAAFAGRFRAKEALLWALVARDPWILGIIEPSGDPAAVLAANYRALAASASGLVGEVFEEERKLTRLYDAMLRLLAAGYWSSRALAQKLYEAGLLERPEMGVVTGILAHMERMGLVEGLRLWRTRGARVYYRHRSNLLSVLLYFEERSWELGLSPNREEVLARLGLEAQFFVGELLSERYGLARAYSVSPEGEVDVVLLRKGRPERGYEVKLSPIGEGEAHRAVEKMRRLGIPRVGLISLSERPPEVGDEALGPEDLVKLALEARRLAWLRRSLRYREGGGKAS